jgi:hypothetical protein
MRNQLFQPKDMIHTYSRSQAITDGVLIDATEIARESGFRVPMALTQAVWARCVTVPPKVECQDEAGRLWDVLWMCRLAVRGAVGVQVKFGVHVRNSNRRGMPPLILLKAVCAPGDDGMACITIMLPDED